jgi:hypothetical protein
MSERQSHATFMGRARRQSGAPWGKIVELIR